MSGRHQTTRGIWLARSGKLPRPVTLVMDLEGSDGRERGEDDNSFERQSALFALAVADVLLVNMFGPPLPTCTALACSPVICSVHQGARSVERWPDSRPRWIALCPQEVLGRARWCAGLCMHPCSCGSAGQRAVLGQRELS